MRLSNVKESNGPAQAKPERRQKKEQAKPKRQLADKQIRSPYKKRHGAEKTRFYGNLP